MPIEYYTGIEGAAIDVRTADELWEALDLLHTQVLDNFDLEGSRPFLAALEQAMERVDELRGETDR